MEGFTKTLLFRGCRGYKNKYGNHYRGREKQYPEIEATQLLRDIPDGFEEVKTQEIVSKSQEKRIAIQKGKSLIEPENKMVAASEENKEEKKEEPKKPILKPFGLRRKRS